MTLRDPQRCCEAVRWAILATAWLLVVSSGNLLQVQQVLTERWQMCILRAIYPSSSKAASARQLPRDTDKIDAHDHSTTVTRF